MWLRVFVMKLESCLLSLSCSPVIDNPLLELQSLMGV